MSSKTFPADMSGLDGSLEFVRQQLKAMGVGKKEVASAMLATEESLIGLIGHASAASPGNEAVASSEPTVSVSVSKWLGNVSIKLSARGERFDLTVDTPFGLQLALDDAGFDAEAAIRNTILRSFGDKLQYKCRGGVNTVCILVKKSDAGLLHDDHVHRDPGGRRHLRAAPSRRPLAHGVGPRRRGGVRGRGRRFGRERLDPRHHRGHRPGELRPAVPRLQHDADHLHRRPVRRRGGGDRQLLGAAQELLRGVQHAVPQGDHHHRRRHPPRSVLLHDLADYDHGPRDPHGASEPGGDVRARPRLHDSLYFWPACTASSWAAPTCS